MWLNNKINIIWNISTSLKWHEWLDVISIYWHTIHNASHSGANDSNNKIMALYIIDTYFPEEKIITIV